MSLIFCIGQVAHVSVPKNNAEGTALIVEKTISKGKILYEVLGMDGKYHTLGDTFLKYVMGKNKRTIVSGPFCTYKFVGSLPKKYVQDNKDKILKYLRQTMKGLSEGDVSDSPALSKEEGAIEGK